MSATGSGFLRAMVWEVRTGSPTMHELAIAQSIMEIVLQHVPENARVHCVKVAVGRLSGVVPESLEFCFSCIIPDTPLERARLDIERVPVKARCRACRDVFTNEDEMAFMCPECRSTDVQFLSGTELHVIEVAVAEDEA